MQPSRSLCTCPSCGPQGKLYSRTTCFRHWRAHQGNQTHPPSRSASPENLGTGDRSPDRIRSRQTSVTSLQHPDPDRVKTDSDSPVEAASTTEEEGPLAAEVEFGLELDEEYANGSPVEAGKPADAEEVTDLPAVPALKVKGHGGATVKDIGKLKPHQIATLSQPLYDDAPLTVMDAVSDTMQLQADKHLSGAAVDACHDMALSWLPPEARERILSVRTGRKLLEALCLPTVREIHMCPNDCVAFIDSPVRDNAQHAALDRCPTCNASRWRKDSAGADPTSRRPAKVFHYTPLADLVAAHHSITALQGLRISSLLPPSPDKTKCSRAQDTRRWRTKVKADPSFAVGGRDNMVLQYSTDGIPFFSDQNYGGWPMMSIDMTLDESVRHLPENMLLHGIVPGPKDPRSMDAYHDILVDDLVAGWDGFDLEYPRKMKARVLLLNIVCDYPGLCKCCNRGSNSGHKPCSTCGQTAEYIAALQRSITTAIGNREPALRTMTESERIGAAIEALIRRGDTQGAQDMKKDTGVRGRCMPVCPGTGFRHVQGLLPRPDAHRIRHHQEPRIRPPERVSTPQDAARPPH